MGLRRVFDHGQTKLRKLRGTSVEVHGHDCTRSRPDCDSLGVERPRDGIDVGEHRRRAGGLDRRDRRHARVRRGHHLVAGTDARSAERDRERVGPRRHRDGMGAPAGVGPRALELLYRRAEHELRLVERALRSRVELVAQRAHVAREVEERDVHSSQYVPAPRSR